MNNFLEKLWGGLPPSHNRKENHLPSPVQSFSWPVRLRCPSCKSLLPDQTPVIQCSACAKEYPAQKGIIQFIDAPGSWPDIPKEDLNVLLEETPALGWRQALRNLDNKLPGWFRRSADEARADFSFLSTLTRENVALDLGTGWGPVATGLAQHCSAVVATDMFLPRLEFLALRCLQENIQNVHLAQANALTLPFEDAQFDLVSMIGVFEWIGVDSSLGITPEESQERCLMECHRVLKAGREIVIGIENRIGMKYLLGQPDDHTQITNITFLNRTEANLRSRQLRNENFDIRTHTMQDYHAILQAAGFSHIRFFAAFPSYQLWEAIVPLNAPEPLHFFLNHLQADEREETDNQRMIQVLRHLSTHGHAAEYVNSFFIVARK